MEKVTISSGKATLEHIARGVETSNPKLRSDGVSTKWLRGVEGVTRSDMRATLLGIDQNQTRQSKVDVGYVWQTEFDCPVNW